MRRLLRVVGRSLAVAAGTSLAGIALLTAGSLILAIVSGEDLRSPLAFLWFWLPVLFLGPFLVVILATLLIGWPLSAWLRRMEWESARAYVGGGAAAGFVLSPLLALEAGPLPAGPIMIAGSVYGAIAGRLFHHLFRRPAPA